MCGCPEIANAITSISPGLLLRQSGLRSSIVALTLKTGDDRGLGELLLIGEVGLSYANPIAAERAKRRRIAKNRLLLLSVLIIELRLSRADYILRIRIKILIDLARTYRLARIVQIVVRLRIVRLSRIRIGVNTADTGILLRVDRSSQLARISLIRSLRDLLRLI